MMIALLSVRSHSTLMFLREGKRAARTWGIESPTMIQKATMPPNALSVQKNQSIKAVINEKPAVLTKPIEQSTKLVSRFCLKVQYSIAHLLKSPPTPSSRNNAP